MPSLLPCPTQLFCLLPGMLRVEDVSEAPLHTLNLPRVCPHTLVLKCVCQVNRQSHTESTWNLKVCEHPQISLHAGSCEPLTNWENVKVLWEDFEEGRVVGVSIGKERLPCYV